MVHFYFCFIVVFFSNIYIFQTFLVDLFPSMYFSRYVLFFRNDVLFFTKNINLWTKSWFLVHCVSERARPINCIFMYCVVVSNNFCCSLTLMTYSGAKAFSNLHSNFHIFVDFIRYFSNLFLESTRFTWLIHTWFLPSKWNQFRKIQFLVKKWDYFPLLHKSTQNHKFSIKNNYLFAWRDFKINFSKPLFTIIFRPKWYFWIKIPFWG